MRGYFLIGQTQFLQPYNEAKIWLGDEVSKLEEMVKDDDNETRVAAAGIFHDIQKFDSLLIAEMHLAQRPVQMRALVKTVRQQKDAMDHLRQSFKAFMLSSQVNLDIQLSKLRQRQQDFVVMLVTGTLGLIGVMLLATATIFSLTKRNRESEAAVRASEERFRIVMNGINDGLFDYDVANGTIYFSPAYKAMLGFDDDEFPNTVEMLNLLLHPDDLAQKWETFQHYQARETPVYANCFRMRHKEGSWRWIMSRGIGIWDKDNRLMRLIGTHTDITEQKEREDELQALNADLETFAYIASHDLRAPLVNLKGFAGEMEHSLNIIRPLWKQAETSLSVEDQTKVQQIFEQDIPEALKFIRLSVDKMDALTNAVLDLSRIGRREFIWEPVNVHAIATRCLDNLAYELSQKKVAIQLDKLPIIMSDAASLEQILSNLLDNAVKYLDSSRHGQIQISCETLGNEVVLSIRDNGRGIAASDQDKVFEIFRRARNAGDERGLGMGLAYVKATLRKLGGMQIT